MQKIYNYQQFGQPSDYDCGMWWVCVGGQGVCPRVDAWLPQRTGVWVCVLLSTLRRFFAFTTSN